VCGDEFGLIIYQRKYNLMPTEHPVADTDLSQWLLLSEKVMKCMHNASVLVHLLALVELPLSIT
jgi:hypothetical protein